MKNEHIRFSDRKRSIRDVSDVTLTPKLWKSKFNAPTKSSEGAPLLSPNWLYLYITCQRNIVCCAHLSKIRKLQIQLFFNGKSRHRKYIFDLSPRSYTGRTTLSSNNNYYWRFPPETNVHTQVPEKRKIYSLPTRTSSGRPCHSVPTRRTIKRVAVSGGGTAQTVVRLSPATGNLP